ncbi:hypothetical protein BH11PSE14_BH11PSE14_03900 [soil metagenome]
MRDEYDFRNGKRGAAVPAPGKTRITIMLDNDVLEHFRAQGDTGGVGYQTLINASLRKQLQGESRANDKPLTVAVLRRILREELR